MVWYRFGIPNGRELIADSQRSDDNFLTVMLVVVLARYHHVTMNSKTFFYSELPIGAIETICAECRGAEGREHVRVHAHVERACCAHHVAFWHPPFSATGSFHSRPSYAACCVE